jgi:hypothetical protein
VNTPEDRVFAAYRRLSEAVCEYSDVVRALPKDHVFRDDYMLGQLQDLVSFGLPWCLRPEDQREFVR